MGSIFDIHTVNVCDCTDEDFLLDTNALLWAFYPNSQSGNSSAADYSNFISDIISSNKHIYIPMFNVCEAIHVIERIQYKIYKDTNGIYNLKLKVTSKNISPKAKKYGIIEPTNKVGDLDAVESICRR